MSGSWHVVAKLHSISKDYQNKVMECSFFLYNQKLFYFIYGNFEHSVNMQK